MNDPLQAQRSTMKPCITIFSVLLGISLAAHAGSDSQAKGAALRLLMSEVQPGLLDSEQYCMLVFDDHHFHAEKAHLMHGKDRDRKVYEGRLSDTDWKELIAILDAKEFRDLYVRPSGPALVVQDLHPYTISVGRGNGYQNMEFLTTQSIKPYKAELRPLLQWWKSSRNPHLPASAAAVDSRCALSGGNPIFSN